MSYFNINVNKVFSNLKKLKNYTGVNEVYYVDAANESILFARVENGKVQSEPYHSLSSNTKLVKKYTDGGKTIFEVMDGGDKGKILALTTNNVDKYLNKTGPKPYYYVDCENEWISFARVENGKVQSRPYHSLHSNTKLLKKYTDGNKTIFEVMDGGYKGKILALTTDNVDKHLYKTIPKNKIHIEKKTYPNTSTGEICEKCSKSDNSGCKQPEENYPYRKETFKLIEEMAPFISKYSKYYGVPPIAVAGAIADEYNTQNGLKGIKDWIQDEVLLNYMPNYFIEVDAAINIDNKYFNATKHDLGVGNIKLETAKQLYDDNLDEFSRNNADYTDLVDYLRTRHGTAHMAALYIAKAKVLFEPYMHGYSESKKEAILITYYKQGPKYLRKFKKAKILNPSHRISPGEGCRVYFQRKKFLKIFPATRKIYEEKTVNKYYA